MMEATRVQWQAGRSHCITEDRVDTKAVQHRQLDRSSPYFSSNFTYTCQVKAHTNGDLKRVYTITSLLKRRQTPNGVRWPERPHLHMLLTFPWVLKTSFLPASSSTHYTTSRRWGVLLVHSPPVFYTLHPFYTLNDFDTS